MKKLTNEEYKAINGLYSYYCSLDFIDTTNEEKDSSMEEQAIKKALGKLLFLYKEIY